MKKKNKDDIILIICEHRRINMGYTLDLNEKIALITGAAGGIGFECAKGFLENGASVFLCDLDEAALSLAAEKLKGEFSPSKIAFSRCDITNENDIRSTLEKAEKAFGSVDILLNNAGVAHDVYSMKENRKDWGRVIDINLTAQFFFTQEVFNRFWNRKKGGKVVFMASLSAFVAVPSAAAYSASKGAVLQLTKSLAGEWARFGVNVNCVCPGFVETPLIEPQLKDERWMGYMNIRIPKKRLAKPEDVTGAVLFLSSPLSEYVTGTSVVVDGGFSACG